MEKKRKLSPRYRLANIRRKLWKNNREHMEAIRIRAVAKAQEIKNNKHRQLFLFIQGWQKEISPDELKQLITSEVNYISQKGKPMHFRSFINRLRRKQLLRYDAGLGKWINLTHLQLPSGE